MKNSHLIEGSLVALGGFVVPLMSTQPAHANEIFTAGPGVVSNISNSINSSITTVIINGGGTVLFTNNNAYTGNTVVSGGTTLGVNQEGAFGVTTGTNPTITLGDATTSGVLTFNGNSAVSGSEITTPLVDGHALVVNAGGGVIITNSGTITSSGSATIASAYSAEIGGSISGTGQLTVTGGGTLILANNNVWNGGLLVNDGTTVQIYKQHSLGSNGNLTTLDNGTLQFANSKTLDNLLRLGSGGGSIDVQSFTGGFTSIITGPGQLTVSGTSGSLTLNAAEAYTGNTRVNGGTLILNSGSLLGDVTLGNGTITTYAFGSSGTNTTVSATVVSTTGNLAGVGVISGGLIVTSGSTVSPGINGSGTLTVGSLTENSGGNLLIDVGSGGASKLVVLTNNAALNGNLVLSYASYAQPGSYNYLTVNGVTTGGFANANTTDKLFNAGMNSNVQGGTITLTQKTALPTTDLPTIFIAANDVARDDAQFANRLVLDRMQSIRTTALAQQDEMALTVHHEVRDLSPYGLWVTPLGGFGSASGGNGAPGYATKKYGLAVGVDGVMAPGWVQGIELQYTRETVTQVGGGTATVATPRIQFYGGYWRGHYAIDLVLGAGSATINTTRNAAATLTTTLNGVPISTYFNGSATAKYAAAEATAALQASGNYLIGQHWVLSPAAGVRFARLSSTGATESGTQYFDYRVSAQAQNSIRPFAGVTAARRYYLDNGWALLPSAQAGIEDELGDKNGSIQAQTFGDAYVWTVNGVKPSSTALDVNLALAFETSKQQSFSLKFMGTEGTSITDQTIMAQYGLRF